MDADRRPTSSTPIVAGNCVYTGGVDGVVRALDLDTGATLWEATTAIDANEVGQRNLYSMSVDVAGGLVHVNVEHTSDDFPRAQAFDADTGERKWVSAPLEFDYPAWQLSNPAIFGGMHFQATTGPDADPKARPGYAFWEAATGGVIHRQTTIPVADLDKGFAGGGIWATPAVDTETKYLFVGTANPFSKKIEHRYDNAILKIDADRSRDTFGTIVDAYKGWHDSLELNRQPACDELGGKEPVSYHPSGYSIACVQLDIDFGASPTLWRNAQNELMVTELQKSGVVHTLFADTMERAWTTIVSTLPPETAGNSASTAYDGRYLIVAPNLYQMMALEPETGRIAWATPGGESLNYHPPRSPAASSTS
ncbi:MAG: PQQ-binding-like beta-propeller repeat protein [Candidatus Binatia bacterium]